MLLIWCSGIFFPIIRVTNQPYLIAHIISDKIYSLVCHQDKSKSFFFLGNKLEVCARCTGIYLGALIFSIPGLIFSKFKPQSKIFLFVGIGIMAADILLYSTGIYSYSKVIALITGLILGSISILYIFDGIDKYLSEVRTKPNVQ